MAAPVTVVVVVAACFAMNPTPVESQGRLIGKKMYYVEHTKEVSWFAAFFDCAKNNSILASPTTAEEFRELTNVLERSDVSHEHFWLGGNDLAKQGNWMWANGQELSFTNWGPHEPNNHNQDEHCLAMHEKSTSYTWNDYICSGNIYYICEYRSDITADWPPLYGEKKFYLESKMKVDWHSAYMYCLRNNSRLARIENKAENDIVVSMIKEANLGFDLEYWLGATDFPEVGLYFWLATGTPVRGYSNWHAGQGMGEDQRCLTYWQSSQHVVRWNDFICTTLYPFVCEYYE